MIIFFRASLLKRSNKINPILHIILFFLLLRSFAVIAIIGAEFRFKRNLLHQIKVSSN